MDEHLPPLARVPALPFAVFDEFGRGADDRVQDYAAALVAAERERADELLAQVMRAKDDIARLSALTYCGCGDQFSLHDPGTCGACMAAMPSR